ncbi:MAG TPA: hypothetical protein V6C76_11280 [Drouetiella sp.]
MTTTSKISSLEAQCNENQARALLEGLKSSCRNGWHFETYRFDDAGLMTYKFFLIDLSEQLEQDEKKFVRYHGWLEAVEQEGVVAIKPAGSLEHMLDSDVKHFLLQRFAEDVMKPVCTRLNILMRVGY